MVRASEAESTKKHKESTKESTMANMLSIYKRKVSLALKIETIARMDAKAMADGSTRNEVAEYILSSFLSKLRLSPEAQQRVKEEIERNRNNRKAH